MGLPDDPWCVLAKWLNSLVYILIDLILPGEKLKFLFPGYWGTNISCPLNWSYPFM